MKKQNPKMPPRWAERFLEWYCRPSLLEDLQGDLHEYFQRNVSIKGLFRAKLIYVIDVLKFFRSYTMRKPEFFTPLISRSMISSYFKTSWRTIRRHKLFSFINIIGLAISMSVGLLMISFISDLFSYDQFHEKKDRIYRVVSMQQSSRPYASASLEAGRKINETISGVEDVVIIKREPVQDIQFEGKTVHMSGLKASESFFNMFTFPMIKGNPATALKEPFSIVITEKAAKKIFGDDEPLGNIIKMKDSAAYVVTGVVKDPPKFSHIKFEMLVPLSTNELSEKNTDWGDIYDHYVYILRAQNSTREMIETRLKVLSNIENKLVKNRQEAITLSLQPLPEIAAGKIMKNQLGSNIASIVVWTQIAVTFLIILSVCFNYTNLSIARSLRRSREVGIRKVMGAMRKQVVMQFITEAVMISLFALVCAFVLFLFIRPHFLSLDPKLNAMVSLDLSITVVFYFILFAIVVGIIAGLFPALFFSGINAVRVLKNAPSTKVFHYASMRKVLIVIQYTISLIFITATVIGTKQFKDFVSFDLGFKTENIINVALQGNKPDLLMKEFREIPEVEALSLSAMISSTGQLASTNVTYKDPRDSVEVFYNFIDENYINVHGHILLAGKSFVGRINTDQSNEIIVNEQLIKRFTIGKGDPVRAIGETVSINGKDYAIVGVVKDFHYGKIDQPLECFMFRYSNEEAKYVNLRINFNQWQSTLSAIEKAWRKVDNAQPVHASFYTQQLEEAYSEFSTTMKMVGFLAFVMISIASIGLLGVIVYATEARLKEISIRKVLGATESSLVALLSRGFLLLLMMATAIAVPSTYLFFENVVLSNFAYHAPIGLLELILSVVIATGLAVATIGSQTLNAARSNPAEVLKGE